MRFICPSCAAGNRVPDRLAGVTIICRKCKTQITTPSDRAARPRSWLRSPRWQLIIAVELLVIAALAVAGVLLAKRERPQALPYTDTAPGAPQLAVPGGTLLIEWRPGQESAGGYFQMGDPAVSLVRGSGPPQALTTSVLDKPWPDEVLTGAVPAEPAPIVAGIEVEIPAEYTLCGRRVTVQASVSLSYPAPGAGGGPLEVQRETVRHEASFVVATEAERNEYDGWRQDTRMLRWLVYACAALVVAIPIAAGTLAQQRVTIKCPDCGRTTTATFYHDGGEYYVSPCPHRGTRAAADAE